MRVEGGSNYTAHYGGEGHQYSNRELAIRVNAPSPEQDQALKKLDIDELRKLPDSAKTQYEKSEEKRIEKLGLAGFDKLDYDQQEMVKLLEVIERGVVMHEKAHQAKSGFAAGAVSYQYTMGPDHKYYKTGGNVQYKLPYAGTPEAMIRAFEGLTRVATASDDASEQDRSMAAMAEAKIREIKQQITSDRGKLAYYEEMLKNKLKSKKARQLN